MRRLLYWLGAIDLAWVTYHSGEIVLRMIWYWQGVPVVFGSCAPPMFWDISQNAGVLLKSGKIKPSIGNSYMKTWVPYSEGKPLKATGVRHAWITPFKRGAKAAR